MSTGRDLTDNERKVLELVKVFESACDDHKMTITLEGSKAAAEAVFRLETRLNICKTLKIDYLQQAERYKITFSLTEFQKYMFYMLEQVGLSLKLDGSLKTQDNLEISNEYLNGGKEK